MDKDLITGNTNEGRDGKGGFKVYISGRLLSPERSQKVINHSPNGFAWGYGGSGPAQLALAILLNFCDEKTAIRLYQEFKWEVVARLPETFGISSELVKDWIYGKTKTLDG